jgi:aryl-alcohol dehydrogenase-like predicted oxidoreductase
MEYRRLGGTGLKVAELCLGCMTFGRETDEANARKIIDRYLELGGNFLDTANVYAAGASEEITENHQGAPPVVGLGDQSPLQCQRFLG